MGVNRLTHSRIRQALISLDQAGNAVIGSGWADETLSAAAWRLQKHRRWAIARRVIDGLFFWEPNHCRNAYMSERVRRHLPPEYRRQADM